MASEKPYMNKETIALVLLNCWCRNLTTVKAIAVLEKTDGDSPPPRPQVQPVRLPSQEILIAPVAEPSVLTLPATLVKAKPLPIAVATEGAQGLPVAQPKVLLQPAIAIETRPVVPVALPVLTSGAASTTKNAAVTSTNKPAANIAACAHAMCPRIFCPNSLPPIPSQGICCQRCIFNAACKGIACPKLNCSGNLTPANLTAGECCDRCAPLLTKNNPITQSTTTTTKTTTTTAGTENSDEDSSSSSEESKSEEISCGCDRKFNKAKPRKKYSRSFRLFSKRIPLRRRSHGKRAREASSESQDD